MGSVENILRDENVYFKRSINLLHMRSFRIMCSFPLIKYNKMYMDKPPNAW
jgi:hypothetical protein